uniref:Uncharacterized protein n=1 Tax=Plectus sambesii TaxID=2011161 RepID=A0A914XDM7_9BILA
MLLGDLLALLLPLVWGDSATRRQLPPPASPSNRADWRGQLRRSPSQRRTMSVSANKRRLESRRLNEAWEYSSRETGREDERGGRLARSGGMLETSHAPRGEGRGSRRPVTEGGALSEVGRGRMSCELRRAQVVDDRLSGAHRSAGAQQLHTERRRVDRASRSDVVVLGAHAEAADDGRARTRGGRRLGRRQSRRRRLGVSGGGRVYAARIKHICTTTSIGELADDDEFSSRQHARRELLPLLLSSRTRALATPRRPSSVPSR